MANYDIVGSIAILKTDGMSKAEISAQAKKLLKIPSIRTVVEKKSKFKGRLRTIRVKHLAGDKNLDTLCRENGCIFKLNVEKCYFSSRLSNERLEVANLIKKIKKKDNVLVMFSGVAPFPIVIQKIANPKRIVAIELGRECHKYALENLKLNKMKDRIELIQKNVKSAVLKLKRKGEKFDIIVMPRPKLKDSFLKEALSISRKGTIIIWYGFARKGAEFNKMLETLKKESKSKIKILKVSTAGDIAPYKFRWRIELKVEA